MMTSKYDSLTLDCTLPLEFLLTPPTSLESFKLLARVDYGYRATRELTQREEPFSEWDQPVTIAQP